MKTEQTTREKRIHRDGMDKYVFEPSRDYAAAFALVGLGVGLCIVAMYIGERSRGFSAGFFVISFTVLFAGVGWALMIKERLNAYYYDIMMDRSVDTTVISEHETHETEPRRIPNSNGDVIVELETSSDVKPEEWRKIAHAVLSLRTPIAKAPLSKRKDTKVISQPCYDKFYAYMNGEGYMYQKDNTNHLTDDGKRFLASYLPTPQPYSTLSSNGS